VSPRTRNPPTPRRTAGEGGHEYMAPQLATGAPRPDSATRPPKEERIMPEGIRKKRELTAPQNRLLAWLSSPKDERAPEILGALSQELGVNPKTLQRWRTKLDLDAVADEGARRRLLESLPTVYRALAQKAEEGSHDHMKLYLGVALTTTPPRRPA
jgi:hypothetical protein